MVDQPYHNGAPQWAARVPQSFDLEINSMSHAQYVIEHCKPRRQTLNDNDREAWIDNDEGLYDWWRSSRQSKRAFIASHRAELTQLIQASLNRAPIR
jgi:hypothetical protein